MEATDELLTIAELAIGLAGFSGIVIAFSHQGSMREIARFYFIALLSSAFTAVFLALVPFFFHHGGVAGAALWKNSSLVMLIAYILLLVALGTRVSKLPSVYGAHHLGIIASILVCVAALLTGASIAANIVGYLMDPGPALYLIGLFFWLTVTIYMFAFLVLVGGKEHDARAGRPKVSNEMIRD
jgi:hypothetical protein